MKRITFDFETGEVIFDTDSQKGTELHPQIKDRYEAIMKAAGFEQISSKEILDFAEQLVKELSKNTE